MLIAASDAYNGMISDDEKRRVGMIERLDEGIMISTRPFLNNCLIQNICMSFVHIFPSLS